MGIFKKEIEKLLSLSIFKRWVIYRGIGKLCSNRIALTFDDGPNPEYTPKILDILNQYKIKGTFFLVGTEVEKYQDLAKRIINEGHCIGNHTYSHRSFKQLSRVEIKKEILKTQQVFKDVLEYKTRLFRPPFGRLQLSSLAVCVKLNLTTVLYSLDSLDWKKTSKEPILGRLNSNMLKAGNIILLHDDNVITSNILPEIIKGIENRGLGFFTVEELLK
ncbi:MAG: polysaccharide deacetylase family protein [Actinomycetota bacterium]